jgi:tetratricopeptide (TPR) repeat protein
LSFALEKWDAAIALYNQALEYAPEDSTLYYNIAAAYTNKHEPVAAMNAFQRVIHLNPTGDLGIEAAKNLDKLKTGAVGRKSFTGSWKIVAVLIVITFVSLVMAFDQPAPGVMGVVFWGGILVLYYRVKYK